MQDLTARWCFLQVLFQFATGREPFVLERAVAEGERGLNKRSSVNLAWDVSSNKIRTKEDIRKELIEMASKNDSTIIDPTMPKPDDPLVLRKDQRLVLVGTTAIATVGGKIDDIPVRITTVWIHRDGRWQRVFGESVKVTADGTRK